MASYQGIDATDEGDQEEENAGEATVNGEPTDQEGTNGEE